MIVEKMAGDEYCEKAKLVEGHEIHRLQISRKKGGIEMEWQFIVALVLGIPIILFPLAFIWYLNISGLYQVMREARQRQKRRVRILKGAEELVQK